MKMRTFRATCDCCEWTGEIKTPTRFRAQIALVKAHKEDDRGNDLANRRRILCQEAPRIEETQDEN